MTRRRRHEPCLAPQSHKSEMVASPAPKDRSVRQAKLGSKRLELARTLVNWANRFLFKESGVGREDFEYFFQKCDRIVTTQGIRGLILWNKGFRTRFLKELTEDSALSKKRYLRSRLSRWLGSTLVRKLLQASHSDTVRTVLTAANITRAFRVNPELDTTQVEAPIAEGITPSALEPNTRKVIRFWKLLGFRANDESRARNLRKVSWSDYHLTTKSGPNGHAL